MPPRGLTAQCIVQLLSSKVLIAGVNSAARGGGDSNAKTVSWSPSCKLTQAKEKIQKKPRMSTSAYSLLPDIMVWF